MQKDEPIEAKELNNEFLVKLIRLAKTYGPTAGDYAIIKNFVDIAFKQASRIQPSEEEYIPYKNKK